MAFGEIRHGSSYGPIIHDRPAKDEGGFYVDGRGEARRGPFTTWERAVAEQARIRAERARDQAWAAQRGMGR